MSGLEKILGVLSSKPNAELREELECMAKLPAFQPLLKFLESRVDQGRYVTDGELEIYKRLEGTDALEDVTTIDKFSDSKDLAGPRASEDIPFLKKQIEEVSDKVEKVKKVSEFLAQRLEAEEERLNETNSSPSKLLKIQQKELEDVRNKLGGNLKRADLSVDSLLRNLKIKENKFCTAPLDEFLENVGLLQSHLNDLKKKMVKQGSSERVVVGILDSPENLLQDLDNIVNTLVKIERKTLDVRAKIFGCEHALNYIEGFSKSVPGSTQTEQNDMYTPTAETIQLAVRSRVNSKLLEHQKCILRDILNRQEMTLEKLTVLNASASTLKLSCDTLRHMLNEELTCVELWRSVLEDYKLLLERYDGQTKGNLWKLQCSTMLSKQGRTENAAVDNSQNVSQAQSVIETSDTSDLIHKAFVEDAGKMCLSAERLHSFLFNPEYRDQIEEVRVKLVSTRKRFHQLKTKIDELEKQYQEQKIGVEGTPYQLEKDRFWIDFMENRPKLAERVAKLEQHANCLQDYYSLMMQQERSFSLLRDFA